ncbi:MAG: AMP-binding protein [Flavobacteriia bacterium]|nr:AMP-binding protein [Flavobacteriia bacterium]
MNSNIAIHFFETAKRWPERIAIIDKKGKAITYKAMAEAIQKQASLLQKKGLKKGDRVLVFIPMSIELYIYVMALFYIGAVAVFVDEWVNKKRLELCCEIADCKGFAAPLLIQLLASTSKALRKIPMWMRPGGYENYDLSDLATVTNDDTALITFTTGSTGIPKAANRTHEFMTAQLNALKPWLIKTVNPIQT